MKPSVLCCLGMQNESFPSSPRYGFFILLTNLIGLIPGVHSPTSDLSVTAALAVLVFLSVHWFGIAIEGITPYLRHYLAPSPLLLPFHIISEISRTLTLAVRLFGNMMSLEMAALVGVAGGGIPGSHSALDAPYRRGTDPSLYFRHAGIDLSRSGAIQTRALHSISDKG